MKNSTVKISSYILFLILLLPNILSANEGTPEFSALQGLAYGSRKAQLKQKLLVKQGAELQIKLPKSGIIFRLIPGIGSRSPYFYMGKYEVTHEQWMNVMGRSPSAFTAQGIKVNAELPVSKVSWNDCQAFIKKLNAEANMNDFTIDLPSSQEWIHSCRAGTSTNYYTGNSEMDLRRAAWFTRTEKEEGKIKINPIGKKAANAYGLYDMHGNVWEWCKEKKFPSGEERVNCGGGFYNRASNCKSDAKFENLPDQKAIHLGFRLTLRKK